MYFFFSRVNEYSVAIDKTLIVEGLVRLPPIVKGDRVGPHVLPALAHLLAIVSPVYAVPEEVIVHTMFEAGPNCCARIGSWGIDYDGSGGGPAAVINPIPMTPRALLHCALNVVAKRSCIPDVDRSVELLYIAFGYKSRQSFSRARIGVKVIGEFPNVSILRPTWLIGQVKES